MTKDGKPETLTEMRSMGGMKRAKLLTKKRRKEIAALGVAARWPKTAKP